MTTQRNPTVATSLGTIEGKWNKQEDLALFYGIPFAKPPVGELRWKPPQAVASWQGTRLAHKHSDQASQRSKELMELMELLIDGLGDGWWRRNWY